MVYRPTAPNPLSSVPARCSLGSDRTAAGTWVDMRRLRWAHYPVSWGVPRLAGAGMSTGNAVRRTAAVERGIASADALFALEGIPEGAVVPEPEAEAPTADGVKVLRQFPFSQSLGWFYETVAEHLGLGNWTSSGKIMGLAGYGNPDRYTLDFLTARAGGSSGRS